VVGKGYYSNRGREGEVRSSWQPKRKPDDFIPWKKMPMFEAQKNSAKSGNRNFSIEKPGNEGQSSYLLQNSAL